MRGVPIHQLCCPTCGSFFATDEDEGLHVSMESEDTDPYAILVPPVQIKHGTRYFVTCKLGHRWTLRTLIRQEGLPDEILLGDFIGGGY